MLRIDVLSDGREVARVVAQQLLSRLQSLLAVQPEVHLVLTGGTVGISSLAAFSELPEIKDVDLSRVHFWWGDERYLDHDHPDRNAVQARNSLLNKIEPDENKVHEFPSLDSGLSLDEAAREFEHHVRKVAPKFDIVLLGMGPDGHVASLFPGSKLPANGAIIFAEHNSPKPPSERLSFSYESLNKADEVWFVVSGSDKAEAIGKLLKRADSDLPVAKVSGSRETRLFTDQAASGLPLSV